MKKRQGGIIQRKMENHSPPPSRLSSFYKHVPNTLTVLRLFGTPLTLWIIAQNQLTAAFWVFFAICLTDWLDGYLARRWQVTSKLGQLLDPLADKCLLISMYFTLALWGFIPVWLTAFVVMRDFLILAIGGGIILSRKTEIHLVPRFMGKISTTLQMFFIGLVLAGGVPVPSIPTSSIKSILMVSFVYSVALTTVLSGLTYAQVIFSAFRKK